MSSGFINLENYCSEPYNLYEDLNVQNDHNKIFNIGHYEKSKLSIKYFDKKNVDYLQNKMISQIFRLTKTKISRQSDDELLIIMKSIFLQYGLNNDSNIDKQISELNHRVLDYSIGNIASNLKQYNHYIKDISSEIKTLDMPTYVDSRGEKTLMPNHFF
jgi:hypothetical protein